MVPATTWYVRISAISSVERFPSAEPMLWNASFVGAKMVTLGVVLTSSTRSVALSAPRSEVRPAAERVSDATSGRTRRRSMTWITPPVKLTSCA